MYNHSDDKNHTHCVRRFGIWDAPFRDFLFFLLLFARSCGHANRERGAFRVDDFKWLHQRAKENIATDHQSFPFKSSKPTDSPYIFIRSSPCVCVFIELIPSRMRTVDWIASCLNTVRKGTVKCRRRFLVLYVYCYKPSSGKNRLMLCLWLLKLSEKEKTKTN